MSSSAHDKSYISQLSLFAGELMESLGDSLNLKWVIQGRASSGAYCSAQGTMMIPETCVRDADRILNSGFIVTVGETAVALTTIVRQFL
jgi:hypothetical protein